MREVNLSGIDLNLLPPLEALLRTRNVTRAADLVGLSQPAMSRALGRLRALFDDELLVRSGRGFVLTPRAQALAPRVAGVLDEVRGLRKPPAFDPRRESRVIRIVASDMQTILIAGPLSARLRDEAPGVDVRMEPYSPDLVTRVESGAADFVFALASSPLPPGAKSQIVSRDRLALVMRRGHPAAAQAWTLADYARCDHVGVTLMGDGLSEIDALLARAGISRRIPLATPHFMAALAAVSASDMVTTISRAFASRFAEPLGLILREPPFPESELLATLVWSAVKTSDPLLTWVRGIIAEIAGEIMGEASD